MLGFFPAPYPDEILYSILARYHIRSGNTSPKITLRELFNSQDVIATVDLPSNLNSLIENLQFISNYQIEDLIYKYTLYPFYSVFLPSKRASQVMESMKADFGGDIHTRTGIMASSLKMQRYLRFCPKCLEEDLQNYGESYWHKLHQTPGVLVCLVHGVTLQDSTIPMQGFNRHEYYAASLENCPVIPIQETYSQETYSQETLKKLRLLAQDISWLINSNLFSRELEWFQRKYIALLIEKNFATATGRVNQKRLLDNFLFFYGAEVLEAVNSMVNYENEQNWLFSIVRKHRKSFHPIRHLLVIRFLTNSIEEFFNTDYQYKPFGEGPWLCLNAAVNHYLKPVITNLVVTHCLDNKKPLGTFSCSCGMVYCRTGPDETDEDKQRIGKVLTYGQFWEQKLKELVEIQELGLRETARQLKVDSRTVKHYTAILKLKTFWKSSQKNQLVDSQEVLDSNLNLASDDRIKYREVWKALQQQYPEASKTTLRGLAKGTYIWLYRNDKEWLNKNSPSLKVPLPCVGKVDWAERDKQVLEKVKTAVRTFLSAEKPARVTICRIGKSIGLLALLEKHLAEMPLTKVYLESVTETVEDFQIRRIKWAIKRLDDCGEEIQPWKVIRLAALRENRSQRVQAALETELYKQPD
ncbi:TnsD family Tn7-like transposition protein [Nostoc sp. UIC 10630]|uniref:TnsD family Tn7-like transposition protein n=1 Tax=Nostoc sp. UIC 10630 TaxID=2100146 RepID=UPI0013D02093|nr:TnsD family Tn7-like transposition protein [Nostoc sp. UIC 10630]NEU78986.1 transposase [Nostoc sp. UIC 10630]